MHQDYIWYQVFEKETELHNAILLVCRRERL